MARVDALIGVATARGLISRDFQVLLTKVCRAGHVQDALEAVAHVLLTEALVAGRVPPAAGHQDTLAAQAEAAITEEVERYRLRGGVLLAKNHVEPLALVAEMCKRWIHSFPHFEEFPPLDKDLEPDAVQQRLALGAQEVLEVLRKAAKLEPEQMQAVLSDPDNSSPLYIYPWDIETACKRAAVAVLRAFKDPEGVIHERVHGGSDGDD